MFEVELVVQLTLVKQNDTSEDIPHTTPARLSLILS